MPRLRQLEQFLRWPMNLMPLTDAFRARLKPYGTTYGQVLLELQREGKVLRSVLGLSEQDHRTIRKMVAEHGADYLLNRLQNQRGIPPPFDLDRGRDVSRIYGHYN